MSLGKYKIVQSLISLQWIHDIQRDSVKEYIVIDPIQQPARCLSVRAVLKESRQWKREVESQRVLSSVQSRSAQRHLLVPFDRFEHIDDHGSWECMVYKEIIGPDLAWACGMMGPEDSVWPASFIRSIAKQMLNILHELREASAVLGIDRSSPRLVYHSLQGAEPDTVRSFFQFDDDGWIDFNDTCTGLAGAPYDPNVVQIRLDAVAGEEGFSYLCAPEFILLNQRIPPNDMFMFGTILFDLAAGMIYDIESSPTICPAPPHTKSLLRSQSYLGKLPAEYLDSTALRELQIDVRVTKDPVEAIYKRLHWSLETSREDWSKATENDRWTDKDLRQLADLLLKMMDYDPGTRITPEDAFRHPFFAD